MLTLSDLLRISARQVLRRHNHYLGVAAAITLGTLGFIVVNTMGRDVKTNLSRDLELLGGATVVKVYFERLPSSRDEFKASALEAVRHLPGVRAVSVVTAKDVISYSSAYNRYHGFPLVGVDEHFWTVNGFEPTAGRLFDRRAVFERRRVCVLGAELAKRMFGDQPAVGRQIPIDRDLYEVLGVIEGGIVGDRVQMAFAPLTTAQDRLHDLPRPDRLYVRCETWDDVEGVAAAIPATVAGHQPVGRLRVEVAWEPLKRVQRTVWWVELFVYVSIGATLMLGGFGIWNGMMAAVRARTREIGLKKAMGAEDRDILKQFLSESLCLSLGSALCGIVFSRFAIEIIGRLLKSPPPEQLFLVYVGYSVFFSMLLGVGAGFYPSLRASRMEVVSAIRYE